MGPTAAAQDQEDYENAAAEETKQGGNTFDGAVDVEDVDGDGKLDLVVGAAGGKLVYYHNEGSTFRRVTAIELEEQRESWDLL